MSNAHLAPFMVAVTQVAPVFLDRSATLEKACELIVDAGQAGARLIVFPTAFIPGYPVWIWNIPPGEKSLLNELYGQLLANAVSIPSESTDRLCRIAQRAQINVVMGMSERGTESTGTTCYNTLLYIAAATDASEPWLSTLRHIAREGRVFVIGCGMALQATDIADSYSFKQRFSVEGEAWIHPGDSVVVNPNGEFIAEPVRAREEALYAQIDLQQVSGPQWMLDVTGHDARPDIFHLTIRREPHTIMQAGEIAH